MNSVVETETIPQGKFDFINYKVVSCLVHDTTSSLLNELNGGVQEPLSLHCCICSAHKVGKGLCFRKSLQLYHQRWHHSAELQRAVYVLAEQMQF